MNTTRTVITAIGIILFTAITQSIAQNSATTEQSLQQLPLESLIGPDGTLIPPKNFTGTLDLTGYTLTTNRTNGAPVILRKQYPGTSTSRSVQANMPDDVYWDDRFGGLPGTDGAVNQIAFDNNGDMYICGHFSMIGNTLANSVAKWDGSKWSALGSGLDGSNGANAWNLVVKNGIVYVVGEFYSAGGVSVSNIAKWDGTQWSALGNGTTKDISNGYGISMVILGNDLYIAGSFKSIAGTTFNGLAMWDGTRWNQVGRDSTSPYIAIAAMTVRGNDLYIGGSFSNVGNVAASNIARWDSNTWSALGSDSLNGVGGDIRTLLTVGNNIYAGGTFLTAGGMPTNNIARWDGSKWSTMENPIKGLTSDTTTSSVISMANLHDSLVVLGWFTKAGNINTKYMAVWDGNDWHASDIPKLLSPSRDNSPFPPEPYLRMITSQGSDLYFCGLFAALDGSTVCNIARKTGAQWSTVTTNATNGLNGDVYAIAVHGSDVYAGGKFTVAGNVTANCIARWDGTSWHALGNGPLNGVQDSLGYPQVHALAFIGNDLYVGGNFNSAGGVKTQGIAKWNGVAWSPVGTSGVGGNVMAFAISPQDELYLSGGFNYAGDSLVNGIAIWNGSTFRPLHGAGPWVGVKWGGNGITDMVFSGNTLYMSGSISRAGDIPVNRLASWNGTSFAAVGDGVYAGAVHNGVIFSPSIEAIAVGSNGELYVGGYFLTSTGIENLAVWDGSQFKPVGNKQWGYEAYALAFVDNILYVGGMFGRTSGSDAEHIVQWDGSEWKTFGSGIIAYHNPIASVSAFQIFNNDLYCGGNFSTAGDKASLNIAKWTKGVSDVRPLAPDSQLDITVSPNPAQEFVTISLGSIGTHPLLLEIFDPLGQRVTTLTSRQSRTGNQRFNWDVTNIPNGVYTCRAVVENVTMVRKIVVRR